VVTPVVEGGGGAAGELDDDNEEAGEEGAGLVADDEAEDGADAVTLGITGSDTDTVMPGVADAGRAVIAHHRQG
jgi:hypothetical protein